MTGHTEAVLVVFDPQMRLNEDLLQSVLGEPRSGHRACARATMSGLNIDPAFTI